MVYTCVSCWEAPACLHVPVGDAQPVAVVHRDHELLEQRLRHVLGDAAPARLRLTVDQLTEVACAQQCARSYILGVGMRLLLTQMPAAGCNLFVRRENMSTLETFNGK